MGFKAWLESLLAFISVILEFVLGAAIFYAIIHAAHYLEKDVSSIGPTDDFLYYVENGGKIVLLVADSLIALFFVLRGIKNAWRELMKDNGEKR